MPSDTFFRLPEEKRQRLLAAAWNEYIHTRFTDVSINKIIQNASIPRGSFYQYFTDKDDLFHYLMNTLYIYFLDVIHQALKDINGDLSMFPLYIFDRFFDAGTTTDENLSRCIQFFQRNPGLGPHTLFHNLFHDNPQTLIYNLIDKIDTTSFRSAHPSYVSEIFSLFMLIIGPAVADTLKDPEHWEQYRSRLKLHTELLAYGYHAAPSMSH